LSSPGEVRLAAPFSEILRAAQDPMLIAERRADTDGVYEELFQEHPVPTLIYDPATGRIADANRAACRQYGWARDGFRRRNLVDLIHGDVSEGLAVHLGFAEGAPGERTVRHRRADGSAIDVEVRHRPVRWHGAPYRMLTAVEAPTPEESGGIEEALKCSEERHRQLFETMSDGVLYQDGKGVIVAANPAAERILGATVAEMQSASPDDPLWFVVREDGQALKPEQHPWRLALASGRPVREAILGIVSPQNMELRWILLDSVPLFEEGAERPYKVYTTFSEITHLRAAESALRDSEERFRALIENAREMMCVVDASGVFEYVSPASSHLLGYAPEDLLGRQLADFCHPESDSVGRLAVIRAEPGAVITFESRVRRRDGSWRLLECSACNLLVHPAIRGVVLNAHDITERRAAQDALRASEEQLQQSQKMEAVGRLAGGVAHDFNNILTTIGCHGELILEELKEEDPLRGDVEEIQRAARRASDLTRQLLAFSRRQVLQLVVLDVNTVVHDLEGMLRRLIGEDVSLRITSTPADHMRVKADRGQIEQVLMNLVVNSRDAMKRGGTLTIETSLDDATPSPAGGSGLPQPAVKISVADTGCGIKREDLPRIFDPFFTTKERGQGTGLGLSTVYGIVEQSGGRISVESTMDVGTVFEIRLPRVDDEVTPQGPRTVASLPVANGETVLLVEDEDAVRSLAERVLKKQGYRVLAAGNGLEAVTQAERFGGRIDLLLTDVIMPYMNGPEVAARLTAQRPEMKVLYVSGYTDDAVPFSGTLEQGAPLLEKPFTPATLALGIRRVLDGRVDAGGVAGD
jgi:PAS domain S-box-containing protein